MDEKKLSRLDSTGSVTTLAGGGAFSSFSSLAGLDFLLNNGEDRNLAPVEYDLRPPA